MYARNVEQRRLTFGVSGLLWNRSLVMYDQETGSLWSHILGEAMSGRLRGTQLKQIPSVMTDWETWRKRHPDSTVVWLSRTSTEYRKEFYRRLEQFVLGIAAGDKAKAWRFDELNRAGAINDSWNNKPVLVAYDRASVTARLYARKVNDRVLTFNTRDGKLVDRQTRTTWEPTTGRGVAGPFAGRYLDALPAITSYGHVWMKFHPKSVIVAGG